MFTREVLGEASGVWLSDYRCRAHPHADGPEEANDVHSIVFVRRGLFCRRQSRTTVTADATRVIFFNPGEPYRVSHPTSGGDDCTVFSLSGERARELIALRDPHAADQAHARFHADSVLAPRQAARLQFEVLARARRGASRLSWEDAVAELLLAVVGGAATERASARHREVTEAASHAIAAKVSRPPSLSRLAAELGYSAFHLSHVFRRVNGVSLRAYHSRLRARLAAGRILEGAEDLTELALDLGYSDHSHLSRSFHREWGMTPSAFRSVIRRPAAQDRSSL